MTNPEPSPERDEIRRWHVPAEADGERLDRWLASKLGSRSRTRLQALIRDGAVHIDGAPAERPSRLLVAGERVEVRLAAAEPAVEDAWPGLELDVLYEDEHLAVIDKPAGWLAHPGPHTVGPSVSVLARRRFGELPALQGEDRPGIVHRLDVGTSGLMVLAREPAAFEHLLAQFRERRVEKTYFALVYREPRFDTGWIEAPIGRSAARPDRMSVVEDGTGRAAATYYEVRERFRGFAWLACQPKTGRTHQIRVHLAHVKHPLVGDDLYRWPGPLSIQLAADAPVPLRPALHAARLAFEHPATGARLAFEAPLPADLVRLLEWLRAHHAPA